MLWNFSSPHPGYRRFIEERMRTHYDFAKMKGKKTLALSI
jgi:hypothetical protein